MRSPNPDRTHQRSTASGRTNAAPPPMSMCDIFMSEKRFIMAIDQGTTGTRVVLFNRDGQIHASAYREIRQIFQKPA